MSESQSSVQFTQSMESSQTQGRSKAFSARDQAAAPVFPGHGDIHGKFHTPSKPSHRATETAAEERCYVLLRRPAYSVLSGNQDPFKESNIKATWIL